MKVKLLKFTAILLILSGGFGACENEGLPSDGHQNGIVPKSINQITDVFELKYGEVKECIYDGQIFKFSITDIEDNMFPCELYDFGGDPEGYAKTMMRARIHTYLSIETDEKTTNLTVSSAPCAGFHYRNDGTDVQDIWERLEYMQTCKANQEDASYFPNRFPVFGEGAVMEDTSLSIYMAKYYPQPNNGWNFEYKEDKNQYKFIFIITNQKTI